jgi:hypothetical protein
MVQPAVPMLRSAMLMKNNYLQRPAGNHFVDPGMIWRNLINAIFIACRVGGDGLTGSRGNVENSIAPVNSQSLIYLHHVSNPGFR